MMLSASVAVRPFSFLTPPARVSVLRHQDPRFLFARPQVTRLPVRRKKQPSAICSPDKPKGEHDHDIRRVQKLDRIEPRQAAGW